MYTNMQNFIQIGLGVSVLCMHHFAPLSDSAIFYFFWFLRKATAETPAPILTQNTSNDAVPHKEVPFGAPKPKFKVSTTFSQKPPFLAPFRRDSEIF